MGIRFNCPNGHKLNVKEFLAGKRGVCPHCGAKFTIPMPAESAAAESPLPVGVGQSQSVEIPVLPSSSNQIPAASGSPSVIIPVTEIELAPPEIGAPPVLRPAVLPPSDLPASILAPQTPIVSAPAGVAAEAVHPSRRERSRRNQMLISLLLLALVVFLAAVLIWVLKREAVQTPAEKTAAVDCQEPRQALALASSGLLTGAHPRAEAIVQ